MLVKVVNDLILASDQGSIPSVVLLDFTTAFDTISHNNLPDRTDKVHASQGLPANINTDFSMHTKKKQHNLMFHKVSLIAENGFSFHSHTVDSVCVFAKPDIFKSYICSLIQRSLSHDL